jgi:hypothetical protein
MISSIRILPLFFDPEIDTAGRGVELKRLRYDERYAAGRDEGRS